MLSRVLRTLESQSISAEKFTGRDYGTNDN